MEKKKIMREIERLQDVIDDSRDKQVDLLKELLPFIIEFEVGDVLTRMRFGKEIRARVVGYKPIWRRDIREVAVQYEIRKLKKDGELYSLINKIHTTEGWRKYDGDKILKGSSSSDFEGNGSAGD